MKTIIATSLNYTPLGRLESITLFYEDGSIKNTPINALKKPDNHLNFSMLRYYSEEFHLSEK